MIYRTQATDISISVAARSETGPCRRHNEDAFQIIDLARGTSLGPPAARGCLVGPVFVLSVFDGCGHGRSGVASDLAAAEIHAEVSRQPLPLTADDSARLLGDAVIAANRAIFALATEDRLNAGMGTTLTVTALSCNGLVLAHVGDTQAYVLRNGTLIQVTRDHTLVEEIRSVLELSPDEAASLPETTRAWRDLSPEQLAELPRNIVMRAVGVAGAVVVDLARVALCRGDRLLLCTDGLSALADSTAIAAALRSHADPAQACTALVDAAVRAGGHDNITVLVADVDGDGLPTRLPGHETPSAKPMGEARSPSKGLARPSFTPNEAMDSTAHAGSRRSPTRDAGDGQVVGQAKTRARL